MKQLYRLITILFLAILSGPSGAQEEMSLPASFISGNVGNAKGYYLELPVPDVQKLIDEDKVVNGEACALRAGQLLPVAVELNDQYPLQSAGSNSTWKISFYAPGAKALALYFNKIYLPEGSCIYVYNREGSILLGPYKSCDIQASGLFATLPVKGDFITLEFNGGNDINDMPLIEVSDVCYFYTNDNIYKGFGNSDDCEVNVNCAEGMNYQDVKNGIVRILVRVNGNVYWCSGSLVNNTRVDGTPYILTADHCAYKYGAYASPSDLSQWVFTFDYESPTCENPATEPPIHALVGATKVASGGNHGEDGSDFYLIKLNLPIPASYNAYFVGWDRSGQVSSTGVSIHHPQGDIRKVSTYTSSLTSSSWNNNGLQSHWKVFWSDTQNGHGVTEGGSSGSPIFNQDGLLIGTLTGGLSACEEGNGLGPDEPDYYGKLSYHWLQNGANDTLQLRPWLDPENTGISALDGSFLSVNEPLNIKQQLLVWPNPFIDWISVKVYGGAVTKISVFNQLGIKTWETEETEITPDGIRCNLEKLPPGIYIVSVLCKDVCYNRKMIKSMN